MTLLALIPARGGSKGIPRKNIRPFCGKPLIQWTIDLALSSHLVDRVVVTTDDLEIAECARSCGADVPFLRPKHLATDTASGIAPVLHALEQLPDVDEVLLLQPTSPLRQLIDINNISKIFRQFPGSSIVSVTPTSKHPSWMFTLSHDHILEPILGALNTSPRQNLQSTYVMNGALYLASRSFLVTERSFLSSSTLGYVMPQQRSVDIDTMLDWQWGEFLMQKYFSDVLHL